MFILMAFSLSASLIFLGAYIWSVRSGQFEDKKVSKKMDSELDSGEKHEEKK